MGVQAFLYEWHRHLVCIGILLLHYFDSLILAYLLQWKLFLFLHFQKVTIANLWPNRQGLYVTRFEMKIYSQRRHIKSLPYILLQAPCLINTGLRTWPCLETFVSVIFSACLVSSPSLHSYSQRNLQKQVWRRSFVSNILPAFFFHQFYTKFPFY